MSGMTEKRDVAVGDRKISREIDLTILSNAELADAIAYVVDVLRTSTVMRDGIRDRLESHLDALLAIQEVRASAMISSEWCPAEVE